MSSFGIYTLANDAVYDQLVALLNSIEVNVSPDIPVCVIPYDERLERVKPEVDSRTNVTLFDNWDSIQRWEDFAQQVWAAHPQGRQKNAARLVRVRKHAQRRYAAFDGSFDKFVVYDADSLAMKPLNNIYEKLEKYDFVFDDWEHKKTDSVAALKLSKIEEYGQFKAAEVRPKLHCSSFFGTKLGLLDETTLSNFIERLINQREVEWINGVSEAFLFNYMTLRCDRPLYNFTLSPNGQDRTGNCADADPFVNIDNVLYNEQGLKPIHRIHYMNYSASDFVRLCQGEDVNICYKDIFLYYRFLKQPEQRPKTLKRPNQLTTMKRLLNKRLNQVKKRISR
ncbi:Npun_R2821/Npun_R2822 family protein [Coleofasciculus sp.]|uniref:Npun_R2821/Npun_R2822 family protein n=1 Tax=Coleofasciculus sp. TaxID=3100458 RepID=UPI003A44D098